MFNRSAFGRARRHLASFCGSFGSRPGKARLPIAFSGLVFRLTFIAKSFTLRLQTGWAGHFHAHYREKIRRYRPPSSLEFSELFH
jgi:hypothetical protein